jgi:hypothetical protein
MPYDSRSVIAALPHFQIATLIHYLRKEPNFLFMLKLNELKAGDIVLADFEGQKRVGDVIEVSRGDHKARIAHDETEYWYDLNDVYAVPLDDAILTELGFTQAESGADGILYVRGPFSLQLVTAGEDKHSLLHYRDETRHVHNLTYLHELQNHYKGMTNHELSWP